MLNSGQGEGLERRFGIAVSAILSSGISPEQPVTFSRLKAASHFSLRDITLEDAYSLHVNRTPQAQLTIRQGGRPVATHVLPQDGIALYDLSELKMMSMESRFDTVRFFFGRQALKDMARDSGHRGEVRLSRTALGFLDPIIVHFAGILEACFAYPEQATPLFLDQVALAVGTHLLHNYATRAIHISRLNGSLAGAACEGDSRREYKQADLDYGHRRGLRPVCQPFHPRLPPVNRSPAARMADGAADRESENAAGGNTAIHQPSGRFLWVFGPEPYGAFLPPPRWGEPCVLAPRIGAPPERSVRRRRRLSHQLSRPPRASGRQA